VCCKWQQVVGDDPRNEGSPHQPAASCLRPPPRRAGSRRSLCTVSEVMQTVMQTACPPQCPPCPLSPPPSHTTQTRIQDKAKDSAGTSKNPTTVIRTILVHLQCVPLTFPEVPQLAQSLLSACRMHNSLLSPQLICTGCSALAVDTHTYNQGSMDTPPTLR